MEIKKNTVVTFKYSLINEDGSLVRETETQETTILQGHRNVVQGVEKGLAGRKAGDQFVVQVPPEEGYGPRRENWTQRVSKKYFVKPNSLKAGMVTHLRIDSRVRPVTVAKVGGKVIDVDLNHPHAGQTLRFDIEILSIRDATGEEVASGRPLEVIDEGA